MGHLKRARTIQTYNSTACGIENEIIHQKLSKAINVRFYWMKNRVQQGHFHVFWQPDPTNMDDYHTKHHPASHHCGMCPKFLK